MAHIAKIVLCFIHFFLNYSELFAQFPEVPSTYTMAKSPTL
jgi:hypothetical protein